MAEEIVITNLLLLLVVFVGTYYLIIKKTFDKNMAAALGALATLVLGGVFHMFDQNEFLTEELKHDYAILAVLFGNLLIVAVASEVGIFQFISIKLLKFTRGEPRKLYWVLGGLTFILSAVVNTIPAILVVGALTIVATRELDYNPKPYLLMEIVVSNTGGLTTLISAITNLIIAQPFSISFGQFLLIALPVAVVLFFISMYMMGRMVPFAEVDEEALEEKQLLITSFNEWTVVKDVVAFKRTFSAFVITMVALLLSDLIRMDIAVIAVGGGVLMVYTSDILLEKILPKVDWALLSFFTSLFILIKGLEIVGVLDILTNVLLRILPTNPYGSAFVILMFSSIFSGVLDNVVLSVVLTPILLSIAQNNPDFHVGGMVWALIFGTNLGGGLTPIGAPPGVLGLGILYRETGDKVGWGEFFRTVGVVTLVRLFVSLLYIFLLILIIPEDWLTGL